MGAMHVLDATGHSTLEWDLADPPSVVKAEDKFLTLQGLGYHAFQRETAVAETDRLDTFDPHANEILWLRPLQGG